MNNQPSDSLQKIHDTILHEQKNITLPKGTVLTFYGCPVTLITDTVVNTDPKGISFAINRVEERNSSSLVKVDVTDQLALIKSLNSGIDF